MEMGRVQPAVPRGQAYDKQNDGEPTQAARRSSRHYEGLRSDALQGSQ